MSEKVAQVIVLGSGTSTGVPVIGCDCEVCKSDDVRDKRTRASIALKFPNLDWIIIDTTPDFRAQVLDNGISRITGVLYTHTHADHCHGFDDLRAFSFFNPLPIPCYLLPEHIPELRDRFSYAFMNTGYLGNKPEVDLRSIPDNPFVFQGVEIDPIRLPHGNFVTCGFRFGHFAYITDFKNFPDDALPMWKGKVHTMIASGIHFGQHHAHSNIPETIDLFRRLEVKRGIITHISHRVSHSHHAALLGSNVELATDGMLIDL